MLKCQTLIINSQSGSINTPNLNIGGLELTVKDGNLTTTDKEGKENILNSEINKLNHLEIIISNTIQTISNRNECLVAFDDGIETSEDIDFDIGSMGNSIKLLRDGYYFVSYNITLDMYSGSKSTCKSYIKKRIDEVPNNIKDIFNFTLPTDTVIGKSVSYEYFQQTSKGFTSIGNSFIFDGKVGDELLLYVQRHEGYSKFYTVPENTNFNIFKIN